MSETCRKNHWHVVNGNNGGPFCNFGIARKISRGSPKSSMALRNIEMRNNDLKP